MQIIRYDYTANSVLATLRFQNRLTAFSRKIIVFVICKKLVSSLSVITVLYVVLLELLNIYRSFRRDLFISISLLRAFWIFYTLLAYFISHSKICEFLWWWVYFQIGCTSFCSEKTEYSFRLSSWKYRFEIFYCTKLFYLRTIFFVHPIEVREDSKRVCYS